MTDFLAIAGGIISIITSIVAVMIAVRRFPLDAAKDTSAAASGVGQAVQDVSEAASSLVAPLTDRIDKLTAKVAAMEVEIEGLRSERVALIKQVTDLESKTVLQDVEIARLRVEVARFENWAQRLAQQVRSFGGKPEEL